MFLLICLGLFTLIATTTAHTIRCDVGSKTYNLNGWDLLAIAGILTSIPILAGTIVGEIKYGSTSVVTPLVLRQELNIAWSALAFAWCGGFALEYLPGMGDRAIRRAWKWTVLKLKALRTVAAANTEQSRRTRQVRRITKSEKRYRTRLVKRLALLQEEFATAPGLWKDVAEKTAAFTGAPGERGVVDVLFAHRAWLTEKIRKAERYASGAADPSAIAKIHSSVEELKKALAKVNALLYEIFRFAQDNLMDAIAVNTRNFENPDEAKKLRDASFSAELLALENRVKETAGGLFNRERNEEDPAVAEAERELAELLSEKNRPALKPPIPISSARRERQGN